MYEDKVLVCKECGEEFVFTAGEQEFYAEKGFENEPGRCPAYGAARKQRRGAEMGERQMADAVCADCGAVSGAFRPSGDRPVYCRECFQAKGKSLSTGN